MTHEINKEVKDALNGFQTFMSDLAPKMAKLDALDESKLSKIADSVTTAMQIAQDAKAKHEAVEAEVKAMRDAMERPQSGKAKETFEEKSKQLFSDFIRCNDEDKVYLDSFAKKNASAHGLELKDLTVNTDFNGGFMVFPTFGGIVTGRIFETSPLRTIANVVNISSDAYEIISDSDQAAGGWVSEQQSRPVTPTPQIDKIVIPVHELYANPQASQKMLDDAAFNAESWLADKVADILSRTENTAFVSGTGVGQPRGFTTYTSGTTVRSQQIQQVNSGTSGAVTYSGLIDLQVSLKEPYQRNAVFVLQRATIGNIMKILDSQNRPIFNLMPADNNALIGSIMTKPIVMADDMPAVATSALAIAYGDFKAGYTIVDRTGLRVLRDAFTSKPNVQFYTTKRTGGNVTNFEAIKLQRLA